MRGSWTCLLGLVGLLALGRACPAIAAGDPGAPPAPVRPVTDTYHGVSVTDPYRWLENGEDPAVTAWSAAENARTRGFLDHLPIRATLDARLTAAAAHTSPSYHDLVAEGGVLFALTVQPPRQQPMVAAMSTDADPKSARIVIDPNTLDPSGQTAIDWFVPSPDGKLVAVSLSRNGSEDGTLHVFSVATGRETGETPIPRVQFPTAGGSLAWKGDASGFWYTRYPGADAPADARHFEQQVYYHALGTDPSKDPYVLGRGFPKIAEIQLSSAQNRHFVLVSVANGDGGQYEHFVIGPDGAISQVTHFADQVVGGSVGPRDVLYLLSHRNAPRGTLLALDLRGHSLDLAHARTLVREDVGSMQGGGEFGGETVVATRHALYVRELIGGPSRVAIFGLDGSHRGTIPLPPIAAVDELAAVGGDAVLYTVATYLAPPYVARYDGATKTGTRTALAETTPIRFDDCEVGQITATSKDGTKIPVFVIRRKDLALDGSHPTLLYGYGGYGVSETPRFAGEAVRLWLDGGGVYAIAATRGGAEFGETWHTDGALTHKQNVFDDFLAAAHALIADRTTSPAHLAILGGSNGGLLMGAALTQAPQLFRAVVSLVGIYDMMRIELDPNGAFNVTEFGTVKDPAQFKAMLAYSPYQHVADGTDYPAIYMATGTHDGRVNPAQSRKMIARLQAATASGHPVYLAISDKAGHGIGSALSVRIGQTADWMAFLFDQLGMTLPS